MYVCSSRFLDAFIQIRRFDNNNNNNNEDNVILIKIAGGQYVYTLSHGTQTTKSE